MIDTDKYEGHTPGPWMWYRDDGDVDLVVANDQCHTVLEEVKALYSEGNENLIADAPLLLQEVKQLREAIVGMVDSIDNHYIRDVQHAAGCLRDLIGYYDEEE